MPMVTGGSNVNPTSFFDKFNDFPTVHVCIITHSCLWINFIFYNFTLNEDLHSVKAGKSNRYKYYFSVANDQAQGPAEIKPQSFG